MWWRLSRAGFDRSTADEHKAGLKEPVDAGRPPGILAYLADEPIAWDSLGPREDFGALERSGILKRVDDRPVWSTVCFFVGKRHRRQGLLVKLLQAAVGYAAANSAQIVEGYPVDPGAERVVGGPVSWGWYPPTAKQDSAKSPGRTSGGPSCDFILGSATE